MKTVPGAHPASYSVGTGVSFSEVRWLGLEPQHSSPPDAEVKNVWSWYLSMSRLHGVCRGKITFYVSQYWGIVSETSCDPWKQWEKNFFWCIFLRIEFKSVHNTVGAIELLFYTLLSFCNVTDNVPTEKFRLYFTSGTNRTLTAYIFWPSHAKIYFESVNP